MTKAMITIYINHNSDHIFSINDAIQYVKEFAQYIITVVANFARL